jgi:hypothetical protein
LAGKRKGVTKKNEITKISAIKLPEKAKNIQVIGSYIYFQSGKGD